VLLLQKDRANNNLFLWVAYNLSSVGQNMLRSVDVLIKPKDIIKLIYVNGDRSKTAKS